MEDSITLKALLDVGAHFGHKTNRWNPKMKRYIFGEKQKMHIIDLTQTVILFREACNAVVQSIKKGGRLLFVGTKNQASPIVAEYASSCAQYYVHQRWLGGTMTNWKTIAQSITRFVDLEEKIKDGMKGFTKKEQTKMLCEEGKWSRVLGGIRDMGGLPDLLFILDTNKEHIAIKEANKLGIPIIAIVDSNSDPDKIDYPIPANDDPVRAITLYCRWIADAVLLGISQSQDSSSSVKHGDGSENAALQKPSQSLVDK